MKFSDKQLLNQSQVFFLEAAGFVIKITFGPSELTFFKEKLLADFLEVWGEGGFLKKTLGKIDFTIDFEFKTQIGVIKKKKEKEEYNLSFKKDLANRKVTTYYHQGLLSFQLVLKEILVYLLERNNGLLLHASSCLDKRGNLKVFFAPSGGGKTTTSLMLSNGGDKPYSDDLLVIRKLKGKWIYFSPPFVEKNQILKNQKLSSAQFFFIKKAKFFAKKEIIDKGRALKLVLRQFWLREGKVESKAFRNVVDFVKDNKFYWLYTKLDPKGLRKIIYES